MRKKYGLGLLSLILMLIWILYWNYQDQNCVILKLENQEPYVTVNTERSMNRIDIWQDEEDGKTYFFLPSCVKTHKIKFGELGSDNVHINGREYKQNSVFTWEEGREYQLQISSEEYGIGIYMITFMKSANIPAVFINTQSGGLEYLHADKENEEQGEMSIVREDGNTEYQGELARISGRGNSTWEYEKKPYAFKLPKTQSLCGLDPGKKWYLLALWREGSKLDNKLVMDIAQEMRLAYSIQGVYIDLYMNGEYRGNYLLTESVSIGEGRVDICDLEDENSRYNPDIMNAIPYEEEDNKGYLLNNGDDITGGYFIEKDHPKHYAAEANGFVTTVGNQFTINAPKYASKEQVTYIQSYVENIDQMVQNGDEYVWEYLDLRSFAQRFLVDELTLNTDSGVTSMYFYKEKDEDMLYSGPVWDYDNAFGERNSEIGEGVDYTKSVLDEEWESSITLNWYNELYNSPKMYQCVVEEYTKLLPFLEELLNEKIDEYVEMISASVEMDRVLWADKNIYGDSTGKYPNYYDNVRYTKYFIAKRLNYLCERWGVAYEEFQVPASNGETHQVTFENSDGIYGIMWIEDGEVIEEPYEYDESIYQGWTDKYTGEKIRKQIPVYDDMVFYNAKWG